MEASRAIFTTPMSVVHVPFGDFSRIFGVPFVRSVTESGAESAIGTIWSWSRCPRGVGTETAFDASVGSVGSNVVPQPGSP
jgi:hypothetical protein